MGKHQGLFRYTIGQRKGLGIAYEYPLYVIDFNQSKNQLIVGKKDDLFKTEIIVDDLNFHVNENFEDGYQVLVKIRYAAPLTSAKLYHLDNQVKVILEKPQPSPTPGQSVVFYDNDILIGGGKIVR